MLRHTALMGLKAISVAFLLYAAGEAVADSAGTTANVDRVLLTSDDLFGGCIVHLTADPAGSLTGCGNGWVSFSCSGHFADRVNAYRMLDAAQLALATGKKVIVYFRDDMKHSGYCFAYAIDVRDE